MICITYAFKQQDRSMYQTKKQIYSLMKVGGDVCLCGDFLPVLLDENISRRLWIRNSRIRTSFSSFYWNWIRSNR